MALLPNVMSFVSAVGRWLRLGSARRSAVAAESADKHAREAEVRTLVLKIAATAQRAIAQAERVDRLVVQLRRDHVSVFALANRNLEAAAPAIESVEERARQLAANRTTVQHMTQASARLMTSAASDLNRALAECVAFEATATSLRQEFERELDVVGKRIITMGGTIYVPYGPTSREPLQGVDVVEILDTEKL
jgi:hypothetical protein